MLFHDFCWSSVFCSSFHGGIGFQALRYFPSSLVVQGTAAFVFVAISLYLHILALRLYLSLFKGTKLSPSD